MQPLLALPKSPAPPPIVMGNSESQPVRNVDKRTARRDNALQFNQAIWNYRGNILGPLPPPDKVQAALAQEAAAAAAQPAGAAVRVCIRRRPIFAHELKAGEFDVISCSGGSIIVHDCRLRPDCRTLLINHTSFHFDRVFDENASSDSIFACEVAPLVRQSASSSVQSCVLMYGQTGSGKTFTMSALQARVADELFGCLGSAEAVTASYMEVAHARARTPAPTSRLARAPRLSPAPFLASPSSRTLSRR